MIAVIPEALSLAVIQCISEYSSLGLFSKGQIVFKNMKSLEKIGKVKYICLGKRGMFTDISGLRVNQLLLNGIDLGTKFTEEASIRSMQKYISLNMMFNTSAWVEPKQYSKVEMSSSILTASHITKGNMMEQALLRHLMYDEDLRDFFLNFQHHDIQVLHWQGFDSHNKRSIVVLRMIQIDIDCREVSEGHKESFFSSMVEEHDEGSDCSEGITG